MSPSECRQRVVELDVAHPEDEGEFSFDDLVSGVRQWLDYGEQSVDRPGGHNGYFARGGWAARCLRGLLRKLYRDEADRQVGRGDRRFVLECLEVQVKAGYCTGINAAARLNKKFEELGIKREDVVSIQVDGAGGVGCFYWREVGG